MHRLLLLGALLTFSASGQSIQVLSQAQVQQLETQVAQNPTDLEAQKLLGENYALFILGIASLNKYDSVTSVDPAKATGDFAQHARERMQNSTSPAVLGEGGQALWNLSFQVQGFVGISRSPAQIPYRDARALAIAAVDRAIALDPGNQTWRSYRIPILDLRTKSSFMPLTTASAYAQAKGDLSVLTATRRYDALSAVAKLAVRAGMLQDAQSYAQELLASARRPADWNYGNAIFFGNMVLGQVAFRQGDLNSARSRLLASGATPGSPQLNSFGPNMSLALDLLEGSPQPSEQRRNAHREASLDSRQVVLDFFMQCQKFWKSGQGKLQKWTADVNAGRIPDFGANLDY